MGSSTPVKKIDVQKSRKILHVTMMRSAPQLFQVFQMAIYEAESFLLLLAPRKI